MPPLPGVHLVWLHTLAGLHTAPHALEGVTPPEMKPPSTAALTAIRILNNKMFDGIISWCKYITHRNSTRECCQ